jgi:hypothetical protein
MTEGLQSLKDVLGIDDSQQDYMRTKYGRLFLKHDPNLLIKVISEYSEHIKQIYINDGGHENFERAFKYTLHAIKYIYQKKYPIAN